LLLNVYGDAPWLAGADALRTVMSWFNVTKYPPSLLFLLLTLGIGLLLSVREATGRWLQLHAGRRAHVLLCAASVRAQVHVPGAMAVWGPTRDNCSG
jgi:uncharacterized membrane protein